MPGHRKGEWATWAALALGMLAAAAWFGLDEVLPRQARAAAAALTFLGLAAAVELVLRHLGPPGSPGAGSSGGGWHDDHGDD